MSRAGAIKKAARSMVSKSVEGGQRAHFEESFQSSEVISAGGSVRVDIGVLEGIAFVP